MAALQVTGRVEVVTARATVSPTLVFIQSTDADASMFSLLDITFLVCANVVPDFLVLFQKKPEHSIQLLGRLDLHFGV